MFFELMYFVIISSGKTKFSIVSCPSIGRNIVMEREIQTQKFYVIPRFIISGYYSIQPFLSFYPFIPTPLMRVQICLTRAMRKKHQSLHFLASWPVVAVLTLLVPIYGLIVGIETLNSVM